MGICLTDLRKGLVKYLLGKGIRMVVHPLAQGSVSGSDLRKMLWEIYLVVLSPLLHSKVILLQNTYYFPVLVFYVR
jgi:hypothetical protein